MVVVILGIIEGLTEFLPISSTGHMLLAEAFLPHRQPEVFIAVIQSGAVLAVLLVFTERLRQIATRWREPETRDFCGKLLAAFAVTAAGGLVLKALHFQLPKTAAPIAWATLVGGVLILAIEGMVRGKKPLESVSWKVAIAVGVGQLLAIVFPGLSRSGATIMMALAMGVSRPKSTEFAFLLGIPTLLAAGIVETRGALKHAIPGEPVHWDMVVLGTVVAAITAFLAVKWLLRFVLTHNFAGFAWYRIAMGIGILAWVWAGQPGADHSAPEAKPRAAAAQIQRGF